MSYANSGPPRAEAAARATLRVAKYTRVSLSRGSETTANRIT